MAERAGITFQQRFLLVPGLANTVTDTHWSERDRMGRSITFLARILQDGLRTWETASVLACDEGVAAFFDRKGASRVAARTRFRLSKAARRSAGFARVSTRRRRRSRIPRCVRWRVCV